MTNKLDLYTRIVLYNNEIILKYTVTMQMLVFAWQTKVALKVPRDEVHVLHICVFLRKM